MREYLEGCAGESSELENRCQALMRREAENRLKISLQKRLADEVIWKEERLIDRLGPKLASHCKNHGVFFARTVAPFCARRCGSGCLVVFVFG